MVDGLGPLDKEDFERLPIETQLSVLYSYIRDIHSNCTCRLQDCRKHFQRLEGQRILDRSVAALLGAIAGFLTYLVGTLKH